MAQPVLLAAGLVLVFGAACGQLARLLRVPQITGYVAAGLLLGPHGLELLDLEQAAGLSAPVNQLAIALVLFVLGGQFRWQKLRPRLKALFALSAGASLGSFGLTFAACFLVLGEPVLPLLLAVLAVETAPATTLLVLDEYRARGPVTELLKLLTALSNVWVIFCFEAALLLLAAVEGGATHPLEIAWDVSGSLLYGFAAGHALILLQERLGRSSASLPLLTVVFLTIGLCQLTGVPHMLAFLVTGAVVVNRSPHFEAITGGMDAFAQPAYVAFFVLNGLHLDLHLLGQSSLVTLVYVAARGAGKLAGNSLGVAAARARGWPEAGRHSQGLGLLCQAGAALALSQVARDYDAELGRRLLNIVLGAVLVFEFLGPVLVRFALLRAGEVQIGSLLVRGPAPRLNTWHQAARRLWRGREVPPAETRVASLLRGEGEPLAASASLDEVLRYANHSPWTVFPVVDAEWRLLGLIDLQSLSEEAYDPSSSQLLIARDLTSWDGQEGALAADASLEEAAGRFLNCPASALAVVRSAAEPVYLGMVEKAEVLRRMRLARRA